LDIIQGLVNRFDLHCMVIIDEVQEMASGAIVDAEEKPVNCLDGFNKIVVDPRIWVIISGSQVSMIAYDILEGPMGNRVTSWEMEGLEERESHELVQKVMEREGLTGYPGIEKDVYLMVGGNPFYILSLFDTKSYYTQVTEKPKSFRTQEELKEVFRFETTHVKGKIFKFWNTHLKENAENLNKDNPDRPGMTYKMLREVADNPDEEFPFYYFEKKYKLSLEKTKEKMYQLLATDLVQRGGSLYTLQGLKDRVLPLLMPLIERGIDVNRESKEQAMARIEARFAELLHDVGHLEKRERKVEKQHEEVAGDVKKLARRVNSLHGRVSRIQGGEMEVKVKDAFLSGKIPLNGYQVAGDLTKCIVGTPGKKEYEIDLVGTLEATGKNSKGKNSKKVWLAVEVKERRSKANITEAQKFVAAAKQLKGAQKLDKVVTVFVSKSGFSKPAAEYLKKQGVKMVEENEIA
jgi:hypothetical protein